MVVGNENIVEVGYIRTYAKQRVDNADKSFEMVFFQAAFTIKNLPISMHYTGEHIPITVKILNGVGGTTSFTKHFEFDETF
jgi:hypothetical protein